ncbi:hypothetical protein [Fusobacterium necrophorum]|uniref:Transposase IS4 n=1 Tax=Fusobacterium necrophorum DJ-2 TaxID=1441737 RepID=A0AB73C4P3_9FUSO|nr:hypothetical protein [Fusobacterium necrophorum]KDE63131.1 hypothetical protein FUSO4_09810 [Fusobacterium necrophorum DJ-1]KDE71511.1 hypothetical protein FUSO6_00730 [Fusobacterium necrophorum DAB]KDE73019.1 hypothetical protein FUSO8_03045 [Fusobacterium necrophorum DJ-2]MCF0161776.1 hypothetical protein [Fusobacterium necrophorum]
MYVAVTGRGKAKVVQFCEQHRIPGTKKKKTIVIRTLGNYEKMLEENPNIIAELKEKAKMLTNLEKEKKQELNTSLFRFGHSLIKKVWEEMHLNTLFEEELSKTLFSLVVYRLGSSYTNFRTNRKTPFANLEAVSYQNFYHLLEVLAEKKEEVVQHLGKFFNKKTSRSNEMAYYHISSYNYNSYWRDLHGSPHFFLQKEKEDLPFSMVLLLDRNGIPISYDLFTKKFVLEQQLEEVKQKLKLEKLVILSANRNKVEQGEYILPVNFLDLPFSLQLQIISEEDWKITEKDEETGEILSKEKTVSFDKHLKVYVSWSKKRAFRDYVEGNQKNGYYYISTNDFSIENSEMLKIFQHIWNIEEKFRITHVDFERQHIRGHFCLCFLCLCIIRYFQYLLGSEGKASVPMIYANKAISNPMVLIQGKNETAIVHPIHLTNSFLKLANLLGMKKIEENMSLREFEACVKLNFKL